MVDQAMDIAGLTQIAHWTAVMFAFWKSCSAREENVSMVEWYSGQVGLRRNDVCPRELHIVFELWSCERVSCHVKLRS